MSQLNLLLRLYVSPLRAFSRILDEGQVMLATLAALAVVLALQIPREAGYRAEETKAHVHAAKQRIDSAIEKAKQPAPPRASTTNTRQAKCGGRSEWACLADFFAKIV